jgi:hypothetical protein
MKGFWLNAIMVIGIGMAFLNVAGHAESEVPPPQTNCPNVWRNGAIIGCGASTCPPNIPTCGIIGNGTCSCH